jgi:hypothetical protein
MFLTTENFDVVDDDREDLALEKPERPLALLAHLDLVRADSGLFSYDESLDLDPPTPLLPYVAC